MMTPTCALPGCNKPVFIEHGMYHDYCSRSHGKEHEQLLIQQHYMKKRAAYPPNANPGIFAPFFF